LALFAAELGLELVEAEESEDHYEEPPASASGWAAESHAAASRCCGISNASVSSMTCRKQKGTALAGDQGLRRIAGEISERSEYIPAR
jgi:hypothetical protein